MQESRAIFAVRAQARRSTEAGVERGENDLAASGFQSRNYD
jgi:hypothetical protein